LADGRAENVGRQSASVKNPQSTRDRQVIAKLLADQSAFAARENTSRIWVGGNACGFVSLSRGMGQLQLAAKIAKPTNSPWEYGLHPFNDSMLAKKTEADVERYPIGYVGRINSACDLTEE
jgi:hypothetical protein